MGRRLAAATGRAVLLTAVVVPALLIGSGPAMAAPLGGTPLLALSGRSPFPDRCGTGEATQAGAEVEAQLAVDPSDPAKMVAAWQQDRSLLAGAGALSTGVSVSDDGGRSWRRVQVPGTTGCVSGGFDRASDPWVSIGADGTAYLATLQLSVGNGAIGSKVVVNRSLDGGATWSPAVAVADRGGYEDKETVTADPARPAAAYAVWARAEDGIPRTAYFARTVDGGATWSTPQAVYTPAAGRGANGHQIAVAPDGALIDVFTEGGSGLVGQVVMAMRSEDQGATWSSPMPVGQSSALPTVDPERNTPISTGGPLPTVAIAPGGDVFVAWQSLGLAGSGEIQFARSIDHARSFQVQRSIPRVRASPFTPALAAGPGGLAVSYYDFRFDRRGDRELTTSMWISHSHDAGRSWVESRIGGPFDMRRAPRRASTQLFLGDYTGLVPLPRGFGAAVVESAPAASRGASDVFFTRAALGRRPPALRILVSLRPRRLRAGRRTRLRLRVRGLVDGDRRPLVGARVRLGRRRFRTNSSGRAVITVKLSAGRYRLHAMKPGFRRSTTQLIVSAN
jgi:hypothetical protein